MSITVDWRASIGRRHCLIVTIKDGKVFANSWDVAEFFRKEHFNVSADIRKRSAKLSPENTGVWFQPRTYRPISFTLLAEGIPPFWVMLPSGRGRVLWETPC